MYIQRCLECVYLCTFTLYCLNFILTLQTELATLGEHMLLYIHTYIYIKKYIHMYIQLLTCTISLCIIYLVMAVANWLSVSVVAVVGPKMSLIFSGVLYM